MLRSSRITIGFLTFLTFSEIESAKILNNSGLSYLITPIDLLSCL
jgi:hypothetical protein